MNTDAQSLEPRLGVLTPLEIDYMQFKNKPYEEIQEASNSCRLPIAKAIIDKDYDKIKEYVTNPNHTIENNLYRQTPLMLAALINDATSVNILMREAGMMDHDFNQAIDFTTSNEIKDMLFYYGETSK